ncbi:sortase [Glycomyces tenuis]|uniref:sortase n=1 Tax=Glycomyces tenuis TaxID=58116 RepID=UPI00040B22B1|nr:class E sortase [Glycomyces tenuis]
MRRPSSVRGVARAVAPALARVAVGALGLVLFAVALSPVQADREQQVLRDEMDAEIADPGEVLESIPPGTPIASVDIPAIGLEHQVVVQGTTAEDLTAGLGHRRDSVLPGQTGLSVIYGRHAAFGAPFADLDRLDPGDEIEVVTPDGEFVFRVDRVRRDGDPIAAREPGGTWLVLVTAVGDPFRPTETIYVDATLTDRTLAAGAVTEAIAVEPVTSDEIAMAEDSGGWFELVLWLQALAVALVGLLWTKHRLGRRETWIMGFPVMAAVLWNVYEAAMRLFPNLL